ncbi:MAG: hypothetical protein AUI14_07555 [Actinobacteria bacterium 13_2_20CM_2_71_6]|nr:MAG: hypothetical protein AUI14_07555 [Actinobacteria bacterium 13_2_20CM_2_71_6]
MPRTPGSDVHEHRRRHRRRGTARLRQLADRLPRYRREVAAIDLDDDDPATIRAFWSAVGWHDLFPLHRPETASTRATVPALLKRYAKDWAYDHDDDFPTTTGDLPTRYRLAEVDGNGLGFAVTDEDQRPDNARLVATAPFRRTEYYLAAGLRWSTVLVQGDRSTGAVDFLLGEAAGHTYQPGHTYRPPRWSQGVFGPRFREPQIKANGLAQGVLRQGDRFLAGIDKFVDATPGYLGEPKALAVRRACTATAG